MKKIIFDTNFLIDMIRFKIGFSRIEEILLESYKLFCFEKSLDELKNLAKTKSKDARLAAIALKIVEEKKFGILKSKGKILDEEILKFSKGKKDLIVATNDRNLRKKLKQNRIKTIYIRGKKDFEMS